MTAASQAGLPLERISFLPVISPVALQVTSTSASGLPLTVCSCDSAKVMLDRTFARNLPT